MACRATAHIEAQHLMPKLSANLHPFQLDMTSGWQAGVDAGPHNMPRRMLSSAACMRKTASARRKQHLHLLHGVGGHDTEDDWDARIQASAEDAACGRAYYGVKMRRGAPHLQAEAQTVLTAG